MAPVYLAKCAHCGTDASMKCSRCVNAPEYEPGDSVGVVYCNRECQRQHWPDHKAYCRELGQRKKLLRAASILKAALLTYREVIYDVDLTKIELQDGVLYLHHCPRSMTARSKRGLFPDHLTTNVNHKEAALANNQCTLAMALLGGLTRKLLKGMTSNIEVLDIQIGKPLIPTKLVPGPASSYAPHTVLKVGRRFGAETWVLDTAGCQYGFQEVLVPMKKYFADHSCQTMGDATTYDATETKDLDFFSTLPFMNRTNAQREDRELERQARLHFAVFVDKQVSVDVLDGSAVEFKGKVDSLVNELKAHMLKLGT